MADSTNSEATQAVGGNQVDNLNELLKWYESELLIDWKPVPREPMLEKIKHLINVTVQLNRIELAKDIKRRHWANEKLRDAYLDAVISVAKENLDDDTCPDAYVKGGKVYNCNCGECF